MSLPFFWIQYRVAEHLHEPRLDQFVKQCQDALAVRNDAIDFLKESRDTFLLFIIRHRNFRFLDDIQMQIGNADAFQSPIELPSRRRTVDCR